MPSLSDPLWDELRLPLELPELSLTPTASQLFMFSAATWNRHHIHYSAAAARAEGHPDIVVHRGLIGNYLARMLTGWLGERGELRSLSWKVVASAVPGKPLRCGGEITAREEKLSGRYLRCAVRVLDGEARPIASGKAELELTRKNR